MSTPQRRDRLRKLLDLLRSSRTLTTTDMARLLNVSRRTVFRDLRELQDRGVNVVWSEEQQAYHLEITTEVPDFDVDPEPPFPETRPMETIKLWFHREVAPAVRELRWISEAKTDVRIDGSIIVEFRVSRFDDILHWILGFGNRAKVMSPPELRNCLLERIKAVRLLYEGEA